MVLVFISGFESGVYVGDYVDEVVLDSMNVSGNGYSCCNNAGLYASGYSNDLNVTDSIFSFNDKETDSTGINLDSYSGNGLFVNVSIQGNSKYGINAYQFSGNLEILNSTLLNNGDYSDEYDLYASSASSKVHASLNWWGQDTGPNSGQHTGNVSVNPYCTNSVCTSTS